MKKNIMMTMKIDGENGGPFISHKRIMESNLKEKYNFFPLWIPRARNIINPIGMYKLIKQIKKMNPDIVQLTGLQLEGFLLLLVCRIAKVKTVLAIHGSLKESLLIGNIKKYIFYKLEKYTIKNATISYGVSDYVSSWEICKLSKNYFGTIYNISKFNKSNRSIKKELGLDKEDIVIVSTGRIVTEKGYDILWEVIKKIGKLKNVKFIIAGEGEYKKEFDFQIKKEKYEQHVFLVGYQPDISFVLNEADIFIICTKHETLCISLLEAAMAKLPLIGTNVGGIPEIIKDSINGYLVDNLDVDTFSEKLLKLVSDEKLRKKMGENAFRIVNSKFSESSITMKLDKLYQSIL